MSLDKLGTVSLSTLLSLHFFRLIPHCGTVKGQGRPFGSAQDGPFDVAQDAERKSKRERKSNREPVERPRQLFSAENAGGGKQCLPATPAHQPRASRYSAVLDSCPLSSPLGQLDPPCTKSGPLTSRFQYSQA